jgi:hypothetical protein
MKEEWRSDEGKTRVIFIGLLWWGQKNCAPVGACSRAGGLASAAWLRQ